MKWCVIGAGGIADRRAIPGILKDDGSKLVAVMDRVAETAGTVGKKYGVPYFTDEAEMLSSVDCDAVYIGTPVFCHYDQAMLALRYGKHVFLEKPVAMNAEEGAKLVQAFKDAGKQIAIGYMMKYHNLHEKAKEIVQTGGIGKVCDVRAQFTCWYPEIKGAWRQKKSLGGGGALMDLGVHCIELIEFLLDEEIEKTQGYCVNRTFSYEVEDSAVFVFQTKSGVLGHVDVHFNVPDAVSESKLEIYGSSGCILCKGTLGQEETGVLKYTYAPQGEYSATQNRTVAKPQEYFGEKSDLYCKQLRLFRESVERGALDYFYADRAVQVQKMVDELYRQNESK